jgi:hypothetical protein
LRVNPATEQLPTPGPKDRARMYAEDNTDTRRLDGLSSSVYDSLIINFTQMTELTKEYFEQSLKATEQRIVKRIDEAQEELARMTSEGFLDIQNRLDVRELIYAHEQKFKKLEEALHIHL